MCQNWFGMRPPVNDHFGRSIRRMISSCVAASKKLSKISISALSAVSSSLLLPSAAGNLRGGVAPTVYTPPVRLREARRARASRTRRPAATRRQHFLGSAISPTRRADGRIVNGS